MQTDHSQRYEKGFISQSCVSEIWEHCHAMGCHGRAKNIENVRGNYVFIISGSNIDAGKHFLDTSALDDLNVLCDRTLYLRGEDLPLVVFLANEIREGGRQAGRG